MAHSCARCRRARRTCLMSGVHQEGFEARCQYACSCLLVTNPVTWQCCLHTLCELLTRAGAPRAPRLFFLAFTSREQPGSSSGPKLVVISAINGQQVLALNRFSGLAHHTGWCLAKLCLFCDVGRCPVGLAAPWLEPAMDRPTSGCSHSQCAPAGVPAPRSRLRGACIFCHLCPATCRGSPPSAASTML